MAQLPTHCLGHRVLKEEQCGRVQITQPTNNARPSALSPSPAATSRDVTDGDAADTASSSGNLLSAAAAAAPLTRGVIQWRHTAESGSRTAVDTSRSVPWHPVCGTVCGWRDHALPAVQPTVHRNVWVSRSWMEATSCTSVRQCK